MCEAGGDRNRGCIAEILPGSGDMRPLKTCLTPWGPILIPQKITSPTENLILHWDRKALTETAIDRKILKKELNIKRLKDQGAMVTACSPKHVNY